MWICSIYSFVRRLSISKRVMKLSELNELLNRFSKEFVLSQFPINKISISISNFSFIIFSLLLPYVHSEGSLGHQARDALLLCMSLSQKNSNVGTYIAKYSSMCPVLVTGLGGLYSSLPNSFDIGQSDWYRITTDDVADIPKLTLFMNCLEFCNAVVQVAHPLIKQQLLDFMYQGFIVPVLGPALLQVNRDNFMHTPNKQLPNFGLCINKHKTHLHTNSTFFNG